MADLFGAPQGIIASNELANQNVLSGLKAQEMMGAISMQPAELALKQSQAKLIGAEATQKELLNQQNLGMLKLDEAFQTEWAARKKLSDLAAASGAIATVADLTKGSATETLKPGSLYEKSVARLKWLEEQGAPEQLLAGERDKLATGMEHEAIAAYRTQQAAKEAETAAASRRTQIGGVAAAAALSPANYSAIMLSPDRALLPKELTGNYATDAPVLNAIATASRTAQQLAQQKEKKQELDASDLRVKAVTQRSTATARLAGLKADTQQEILNNLKKYGGETAAATLDQKRTTTAARKAAADAKTAVSFPPLPLDPKLHTPGTTYTTADGRRVVAEGIKGQPLRYRVVTSPTAAEVRRAAEASLAESMPAETADETGD